MKSGLLFVGAILAGYVAVSCADWLRPSCQVIKAANAACYAVEFSLPDGGTEVVQLSPERLNGLRR